MNVLRRFAIALLSLGFFLSFHSAHAAPIGVTVAPIRYTVNLDPGQTYSDSITVANPNDFVLRVRPEFQDFRVTEGNNIQWIPSDIENPYRMTDWISMTSDVITLQPRQEQRIPFRVFVPRNANAGGRYAAIFFTAVLDDQGSNVGAIPRVGALIILNVNGNLDRTGNLTSFTVARFVVGGPTPVDVHYLNTGTTHYESNVTVEVKNILGSKHSIPVEKRFVYPGIERIIQVQWPTRFPLGLYHVTVRALDGNGTAQIASRWLVAMPLKLVLPFFIALALLFIVWKWFRKKFKIVRAI